MARKNPRRNIHRVEVQSDSGKTYGGWNVRFQRKGQVIQQFFSDSHYGGRRNALAAAKLVRDEIESSYRKYTVAELEQVPNRRNKSGHVGVRLHKQIDIRGEYEYHYWYWIAQWTDGRGRRRTRSFSVQSLGHDEAFRRALAARKRGVRQAKR